MIHVLPIEEVDIHTDDTTCDCEPDVEIYGEIVVIHKRMRH